MNGFISKFPSFKKDMFWALIIIGAVILSGSPRFTIDGVLIISYLSLLLYFWFVNKNMPALRNIVGIIRTLALYNAIAHLIDITIMLQYIASTGRGVNILFLLQSIGVLYSGLAYKILTEISIELKNKEKLKLEYIKKHKTIILISVLTSLMTPLTVYILFLEARF